MEKISGLYKSLCIFTHSGKTFTFKHVTIDTSNESVLSFICAAMSDGDTKFATFPKANICGWSVTRYPEDKKVEPYWCRGLGEK